MVLFPDLLNLVTSAPSLTWYYKIFSSYHIFPDKLLTNYSLQHFANTHQLLHHRQNIFCNQSLQYTAVLDCMKALIAKLYLAAKQLFFLGGESRCMLIKCYKLKCMLRFHFVPAIDWTIVFSCIIQCYDLRRFWKGLAEQNVGSRILHSQSLKYWRNKRGSNCRTEFSLCINYDSFISFSLYISECHITLNRPCKIRDSNCLIEFSLCTNYDSFILLSFTHFGIPYNLKSALQQTGEISCVIEILVLPNV